MDEQTIKDATVKLLTSEAQEQLGCDQEIASRAATWVYALLERQKTSMIDVLRFELALQGQGK